MAPVNSRGVLEMPSNESVVLTKQDKIRLSELQQ